ncbi:hypothetical protein G7Y89_g1788 [Cudoniella acicularis]|uniref:Nucleolar 27S pre-rRNA processing Urb2/Npa2 C-terminal domain-containing protein n=1 Tax=Cudoniella acicularis TaxID=354080 RepID=A0A8H4RVE6_9HELO|nr:hypothetical protein G7Y89_g1788 [Cudoniella acicularis]
MVPAAMRKCAAVIYTAVLSCSTHRTQVQSWKELPTENFIYLDTQQTFQNHFELLDLIIILEVPSNSTFYHTIIVPATQASIANSIKAVSTKPLRSEDQFRSSIHISNQQTSLQPSKMTAHYIRNHLGMAAHLARMQNIPFQSPSQKRHLSRPHTTGLNIEPTPAELTVLTFAMLLLFILLAGLAYVLVKNCRGYMEYHFTVNRQVDNTADFSEHDEGRLHRIGEKVKNKILDVLGAKRVGLWQLADHEDEESGRGADGSGEKRRLLNDKYVDLDPLWHKLGYDGNWSSEASGSIFFTLPSLSRHHVIPSSYPLYHQQPFNRYPYGLVTLTPSLFVLRKLPLHSSYARPAPKPKPTKAGHALRLNSRTEKTTPKERPREERIRREERQRSHFIIIDYVSFTSRFWRIKCWKMASQSRAAQEHLVELEKASAPFAEQLVEAAQFIGVDLDTICKSSSNSEQECTGIEEEKKLKRKTAVYHGREEWLFKWLLKKLQAEKDEVPRRSPAAWRLFDFLIGRIPRPIVARLLIERKFMGVLRLALEEAQKITKEEKTAVVEDEPDSSSTVGENSPRPSKKRKRSPELVQNTTNDGANGLLPLLDSIYTVLNSIVKSAETISGSSEGGASTVFSAEYMKTALRTSAEESATILGLWLSLSTEVLKAPNGLRANLNSWLVPFIEIWGLRAADDTGLMLFSRHCTQYLLQLLRAAKSYFSEIGWLAQLEQLIARNIIIPAKSEKFENADSVLLSTLTKVSVIQNTANAPIFFDIAVRSIQTHGSQRRRPQDEEWLQTVFTTLKDAFVSKRKEENSKALYSMLQSAIKFKVVLDLSTLRRITSKLALAKERSDWKLVAVLINLDANVFLIPEGDKDLLNELFTRITKASLEPGWVELANEVVLDILAPLMSEFAKARDLSGFIRHWYAQLVEFERLRQEARRFSMDIFSAWEDDALQAQLNKLLEPSLTIQQITQIIDWLSLEVKENPNAVCVILEAIAGSISREEVVDAIDMRLYHIMFDDGAWDKLYGRYKWRSWRILSQTLDWVMVESLDDIAKLPDTIKTPFDALKLRSGSGTLLEIYDGSTASLEGLEMLRCACALWTTAGEDSSFADFPKRLILDFLQRLAGDLRTFPQDLLGDSELGQTICGSRQNTLYRGIGWMVWSLVQSVFVEYPKVLPIAWHMKDQDSFLQMLHNIFWVASASTLEPSAESRSEWLRLNPDAFTDLWLSAIQNDFVLNDPIAISKIINVMLKQTSNSENPLIKSKTMNTFAVESLLKLPLEVFRKEDRERVMKLWHPSEEALEGPSQELSQVSINPALLSLRIRMLRRPTYYEGMSFKDLVRLADVLASSETANLKTQLSLFREFARSTILQMTTNMDQARDRTYISDMISEIKKKLKTADSKDKDMQLTFSWVALIGVALSVLRVKTTILNDLDIISASKLQKLATSFKEYLLDHLKVALKKAVKNISSERKRSRAEQPVSLLCAINALFALGVASSELTALKEKADLLTTSESFMADSVLETGRRLETFFTTHSEDIQNPDFGDKVQGDLSTIYGRQSILEKVRVATASKTEKEKLLLLDSLFGVNLSNLSDLDVRNSHEEEDDQDNALDLSMVYSVLCGHLYKATSLRQFCLMSETMELMLRTKGRSMSQWNIDSTLGGITTICSRNGPALRPNHAGTIYLHLCHLLQAVLVLHRLKLQGHFHLVVQVMQTLLRCLFTPLPHSTTKTTKFLAPPPWLTSPNHQLTAKHAAAFTRLVTLICDPSVSSVTRSTHNNLNSATDKAKGMAAQHMQFVLTSYIKLQLEMRMAPEVREKMIPGLYAIFDGTSVEMRRMIGESLDASGRAVFGTLLRDYLRFGKWKGS